MAEAHKLDVIISMQDRASGGLNRLGSRFGIATKQGLAMGAAFKAIDLGVQLAMQSFQQLGQWLGDSVEKTRQFQRAMTEVRTMLTEMEAQVLPNLTAEVVEMSIAFGKSTTDLARGLYQVLSAGIDVSKSMIVLRESAKLATVGLTSVESAVDTTTTVLNAYGMAAEEVINVSNIMWKTVELGKLRVEDLSNALGFVVPIAAQAGVSFEEVSAALATMTKQGIRANMATRGLRQLLNTLIAPSEEARNEMIGMGIAYDDLTLEALGLKGTIDLITDATGGQIGEITKLIPNVRALSAALALGAQEGDIFENTLDEISNSFGDLNRKFQLFTEQDPLFKKERITQINEETQRFIGEALLPAKQESENFGAALQKSAIEGTPVWSGLFGLFLRGGQILEDVKNQGKAYAEEAIDPQNITAYLAEFERLNREIGDQEQLITKLTARQQLYNRELDTLRETKQIATQVHDLSEALRLIPRALKDAAYTTKIFDIATQALVDSIRIQRDEIERLNDVQRDYNIVSSRNSLAILQIQQQAANRRGRLTRNEKQQLKEIEKANTTLRINTLSNQIKIDESRRDLSPEEEKLEGIKRTYAEQIHVITDSYNRDQEAMQLSIDFKQQLIYEYNSFIFTANENVLLGQALFYNTWLELDRDFQRRLYAQNPDLFAGRSITPPPAGANLTALGFTRPGGIGLPGNVLSQRPISTGFGSATGANIHVDPISINMNVNNNDDTQTLARKLQLALQEGLIEGITTAYS